MAKEEKIPITTETIQRICGKFDFAYETDADGNVFAMVGGEKIEVKFQEDGALRRGRNKFLSEARKQSPEFAAAYPPSKKQKASISAKNRPLVDSLPKLNKAFLMKYTEEALEGLQKLLPDILAKKEEEKKSMEKISALEEVIAKLKTALEAVVPTGFPPPDGMQEKLTESEMKLADLRKPRV